MSSIKVNFTRMVNGLEDEPQALLALATKDPSVAVDVLNALNEIIEDSQSKITDLQVLDTVDAFEEERMLEGVINNASSAMYDIVKNDQIVSHSPDVIETAMSLTKDLMVNGIGDGASYSQFHGYYGFAHVDNPYAFQYSKTSPIQAYVEAAKSSVEASEIAIDELKSMAEIGALAPGMSVHIISDLAINNSRVVPSAHEALTALVEGGVLKDDYVHSHFNDVTDQYVIMYDPDTEGRSRVSDLIVYTNPGEKIADFVLKTRFSESSDPLEMHETLQEWADKGLISSESSHEGQKLLERNVYQLAKHNFENGIDLNQDIRYSTASGPMSDNRLYSFTSDSSLFHMVATSKQNYLDAHDALNNLTRYAENGQIDNASAAFFIAKIGSSNSEFGAQAMPLLVDLVKKGMDDGQWRYFGPGRSNGRAFEHDEFGRKIDQTWDSYGEELIGEGRSTDALIQLTNSNFLVKAEDTADIMRDLHAQGYISKEDMDYGLKKIKAMPQVFQDNDFVSPHQQLINEAEYEGSIHVFDSTLSHLSKDVYEGFSRNDLLFKGDLNNSDITAKGNIFIAGNVTDSNLLLSSMNIDLPTPEIIISGNVSGNTSIVMQGGEQDTLIIKGDVGPNSRINLPEKDTDVYVYGTIHPDAVVDADRIVSEIDTGSMKVQFGNNQAESSDFDIPASPTIPSENLSLGMGSGIK